jgi:hypothetical protein
MTMTIFVAFLVAHGLLHLAIWLPQPKLDAAKPPPFEPDHSAVLTMIEVPRTNERGIAVGLAWATTLSYVVAAFVVAAGGALEAPALACAALMGLVLKALYFHPWLSVGVLLDVLVLAVAVSGWPVSVG